VWASWRSILVSLISEPSCLATTNFLPRVVVFYPTAAVIALFLNILVDPLNDRAEDDVALLTSTADLFPNMPIYRATPHEVAHIQLVTDFVAELCRLSKKAIAKATSSRS